METPVKLEKTGGSFKITRNDSQGLILFNYIFKTIPKVQKQLKIWERQALQCPDEELRKQALSSLKNKAFHCQGGAVFAGVYPGFAPVLVRLIVAYQTICDYLDNLCDRAGVTDGKAFRQLHQALIDALTPGKETAGYYNYYPLQNDGGYLNNLVQECRTCIETLPSYSIVSADLIQLAEYYCELQVRKHIDINQRENVLKDWANKYAADYPDVKWQEFSAACGSTLAIFALFVLATREDITREDCSHVLNAYFPWICGLHILLDYFIDQEEDIKGGDLNFTFYYENNEEMFGRLKRFVREAHASAASLFDKTVVEGLLAMYLSDKKVTEQGYNKMAHQLLNESGIHAWRTYRLCSLVRRFV